MHEACALSWHLCIYHSNLLQLSVIPLSLLHVEELMGAALRPADRRRILDTSKDPLIVQFVSDDAPSVKVDRLGQFGRGTRRYA